MSSESPSSRLSVRLVGSHVLLTGLVALVGSVSILGLFYLVEDKAYESILQSALEDPSGPLSVWDVDTAPQEVAAWAVGHPDGTREVEAGEEELHVTIATAPDGSRRIAVLESGEIGTERTLALLLVGGVMVFSLLSMAVGVVVARRTLAPLERLAAKLDPEQPPPTPEEWRADAGDDEVGVVARQLARYVEEREAALQREHEFLRDASHELRNPLSVLHGAVALLRETGAGDAETFSDRLGRMDRSVQRMRRTVEGLLTLARLESEAAAVAGRPLGLTLADLIDESSRLVRDEVEITTEVGVHPPGPLELWIVVIRNLVENAAAATEHGSIHVAVGPAGVSVRDTGKGMDDELLRRVTEAFVGGPGSAGFGLGLAIVHRLAKRLGANVEIERRASGTLVSVLMTTE